MRVLGSKKKWIGAAVGVAVIGTFVTVALGSDTPSGFVTTSLTNTRDLAHRVNVNSDRIKLKTKHPTDVQVARVDIAAGGYSGWHHHPGIVIVTVASGAVTFTHSDCSSKTYGPGLPNGAVFVEGGDDPGQASSATGATLYATFIAPDNAGFRINDHNFPGC